ncbi:20230_t:CDS:2, partial [Cetraspora pellucida]
IFRAAALSGASTRIYEVLELCDRIEQDYVGKGEKKDNLQYFLFIYFANLDVNDQKTVDEFLLKLDKIPNKSNLGANAIPSVSFAVAKAGNVTIMFLYRDIPLYAHIADLTGSKKPYVLSISIFNMINGSSHA